MDYRRCCQWAEWSLVAAVAGLNVTIFFWREIPFQPNYLLIAAHDAQLLSAMVLIVGWILLGPGRHWIRLSAAPFLLGLWMLPWNKAMQPRDMPAEFFAMLAGGCALMIGGMRLVGLQIGRSTLTAAEDRRAQFSIFGLLIATTLIAGAIGAVEAARSLVMTEQNNPFGFSVSGQNTSPSAIEVRTFMMAATVALAGISGAWTVLRPGAVWVRSLAFAAIIPAAGLYLAHLSDAAITYAPPSRTLLLPVAFNLSFGFAVIWAYCGLCALPLRLQGFRLCHRRQLRIEPALGAVERLAIAPRVAAIVSLCIALGLLSLGDRVVPQKRVTDSGRINVNGIDLARFFAPSVEHQTPINAMAQWINPNVFWMELSLCPSSSNPFLQADWLAIPLNDVWGLVRAPAPAVTASEGTYEQSEDQP